jgi:hypothetical protein
MRPAGGNAPGTRPGTNGLAPVTPRLLGVREAAHYLGVSAWSVREWVAAGIVPAVKVMLPTTSKRKGETCRRVLVDIKDLDTLIEHWKGQAHGR